MPTYHAIVQKVFPKGAHGPYAKARSDSLGTVTFSLKADVWREAKWPEEGTCVVMTDVNKKRAGWRAGQCRFVRPGDEVPTEATATIETSDKRTEH